MRGILGPVLGLMYICTLVYAEEVTFPFDLSDASLLDITKVLEWMDGRYNKINEIKFNLPNAEKRSQAEKFIAKLGDPFFKHLAQMNQNKRDTLTFAPAMVSFICSPHFDDIALSYKVDISNVHQTCSMNSPSYESLTQLSGTKIVLKKYYGAWFDKLNEIFNLFLKARTQAKKEVTPDQSEEEISNSIVTEPKVTFHSVVPVQTEEPKTIKVDVPKATRHRRNEDERLFRGESEPLIKDKFGRNVQRLTGTKAQQQMLALEEQYRKAIEIYMEYERLNGRPAWTNMPEWWRNYVTTNNIPENPRPTTPRPGPITTCRTLENPMYGRVYTNGVYAQYSCDPGFTLEGDQTWTCEYDRWTSSSGRSTPPRCVGRPTEAPSYECDDPPSIDNGLAISMDPKTARYQCLEGYRLQGREIAQCAYGRWNVQASCIEEDDGPISDSECPALPDFQQGMRVVYSPDRKSAMIRCSAGYTLIGPDTTYCVNGQWQEPIPKCQEPAQLLDVCPRVQAPEHGEIVYQDNKTVRYRCSANHRIVGSESAVCRGGRWSSDTPVCEHVSPSGCSVDQKALPYNALIFYYQRGDVRIIECMSNTTMIGDPIHRCENGRWIGNTDCVSRRPGGDRNPSSVYKDAIDCAEPPNTSEVTMVVRGKMIYYRCKNPQDQMEGSIENKCDIAPGGWSWSHTVPICTPRMAPSTRRPYPPPYRPDDPGTASRSCHPRFIHSGKVYAFQGGKVVMYICDEDYRIRGPQTLTCKYNRFDNAPECIPTRPGLPRGEIDSTLYVKGQKCTPPFLTPGMVVRRFHDGGSTAELACEGDLRKTATITCEGSGYPRWTEHSLICNGDMGGDIGRIQPPRENPMRPREDPMRPRENPMRPRDEVTESSCEPFRITNGRVYHYSHNYIAAQCNAGFVSTTNLQWVICDPSSRQWSAPPQTCVLASVTPDPRPINMEAITDYTSPGSAAVKCLPLRSFDPNVLAYIYRDGDMIGFKCTEGFDMVGSEQIYCQNGQWNADPPRCRPNGRGSGGRGQTAGQSGCGDVEVQNGRQYYFSNNTVVFQCNPGFAPRRPVQRTSYCHAGTTWYPQVPECTPGQDERPQVETVMTTEPARGGESCTLPDDIFRNPNVLKWVIIGEGRGVMFKCLPGYNLIGTDKITCDGGRWDGYTPQCARTTQYPGGGAASITREQTNRPKSCPSPPSVAFADMYMYRNFDVTELWYQCRSGYKLSSGNGRMTCIRTDGEWRGDNIECVVDANAPASASSTANDAQDLKYGFSRCGPVPFKDSFAGLKITEEGRVVQFLCHEGYVLDSLKSRFECVDHKWNVSELGSCMPCTDNAPKVDNAEFYSFEENSRVVYQCLPGYKLNGPVVWRCGDTEERSCVKMEDEDTRPFPKFEDGTTDTSNMTETDEPQQGGISCSVPLAFLDQESSLNFLVVDEGKTIQYTCPESSEVQTSTCTDNEWSQSEPACGPRRDIQFRPQCNPETAVEPDHGTFFNYGGDIYYQCDKGYRMIGSRIATCNRQDDARFSTVQCVRTSDREIADPNETNQDLRGEISCTTPPDVVNGEVRVSDNGNTITIKCYPSYRRSPGSADQFVCDGVEWTSKDTYNRDFPQCTYGFDPYAPLSPSYPLPIPTPRPLPSRGDNSELPPIDIFGRPHVQQLTGPKADQVRQAELEQYKLFIASFKQTMERYNNEVRNQGARASDLWLEGYKHPDPAVERQVQQYYRNELLEADPSRLSQRRNRRRQNADVSSQQELQDFLTDLQEQLEKNNLTTTEIQILNNLPTVSEAAEFLRRREVNYLKEQDSPIQAANFLQRIQSKSHSTANETPVSTEQTPEVTESVSTERTDEVQSPSTTVATTEAEVTTEAEITSTVTTEPVTNTTEPAVTPQPKRKLRYDTSCSKKPQLNAPSIDNGFVYVYQVSTVQPKDEKKYRMVQAKYRCNEGFKMQLNNTDRVYCRQREWIGELPRCIADDV